MSAVHAYAFVLRGPCRSCGQTGGTAAEDWVAYRDWAADRGFDELDILERAAEFFIDVRGLSAVPPMNHPCDDCGGSGSSEMELPFAEVIAELRGGLPEALVTTADVRRWATAVKTAMSRAATRLDEFGSEPEKVRDHMRVVQEGAEALRQLSESWPHANEENADE